MSDPVPVPATQRLAGTTLALLFFLSPGLSLLIPRVNALLLPLAAVAFLPLLRRPAVRPDLLWLGLLSLLLFTLGILRSPVPDRALLLGAQVLGMVLAGGVLWSAFPRLAPSLWPAARRALLAGLLLALLVLGIELMLDQPLGHALAVLKGEGPPPFYSVDRGIIILSLLLWPLAAMFLLPRLLVLVAGLAVLALILQASSQASVAGLVAGLTYYALAGFFPAVGWKILRLILAGVVLGMPLLLPGMELLLAGDPDIWVAANSGWRLHIWQEVNAEVWKQPWIGYGTQHATLLPFTGASLHPHNGVLQVWLEFGLPGPVCLLAALLVLLEKVKGSVALQAGLCAWLLVFCVSYDIWQVWWLATGFLLLLSGGIAQRLMPPRPLQS